MPVEMAGADRDRYPVARRAYPAPGVEAPLDEDFAPSPFPPEAIKGWASSFALHGLALLVLAFWYFAPKEPAARPIDTRLMGSERGVDEGLSITGGLNMPLGSLQADPESESPEPALTVIRPIEPTPLGGEKKPAPPEAGGAEEPSGDGGMESDNPGAGDGDGFGLARFGQGGENIQGVAVKVGDPQFTLLWDSEADLDLHVIEPGGQEIYWETPQGRHGGELDVDNTKGYGPENIYWLEDPDAPAESRVKGAGPPGEYRWFVVYWGGFGGIATPTRWKVRIKHDNKVSVVTGKFKTMNERSRTYTLKVAPAGGKPTVGGEPEEFR